MHAVLNAALPIFALILTGFLCARFGNFGRSATDSLNRFAIYLALPALMFVAMSEITPEQVRQVGFALTFACGIAVTFALGFVLSRWRGRSIANASIEGLDAGYSNVGFMGIPLCLCGIATPAPLERFATILGSAASPCALICIGLFLAQEPVVKGDVASIGALVALKLLVQPAMTALFAFYVFEVPALWAHSAVLLSALPIGSGPFTIAKLYGLEAGVTSGAILMSHLCSVATVSVLVAWVA
jgi:predicted permease